MSEAPGIIEVIISAGTALLVSAVSYGVIKEKVRKLEEELSERVRESRDDRRDIREAHKQFVTYTHLEMVVTPIRDGLRDLQRDTKEILNRLMGDKK